MSTVSPLPSAIVLMGPNSSGTCENNVYLHQITCLGQIRHKWCIRAEPELIHYYIYDMVQYSEYLVVSSGWNAKEG